MGNNIEENIFILKALILCVCQHRMSDTVFQSPSSSCFFMLQTCHHPASLRVTCGYETEFGPTECEWMGLGNPHSFFFLLFLFWLVVMATSRMALEATYSRWQNLCQLGFLNEGWSRTLHPNTHIICHLPGLLHNDTITTFVEPLQICSSLLSKCSLNY